MSLATGTPHWSTAVEFTDIQSPLLSSPKAPKHNNSQLKTDGLVSNTPQVYQRLISALESQPPLVLSDPMESYIIRQFVEHIAPAMNLYALDNVYTDLLPSVALSEPVLYFALIAYASLGLHLKSPGLIPKDIPTSYHLKTTQIIYCGSAHLYPGPVPLDHLTPSRALLHILARTILLLYSIIDSADSIDNIKAGLVSIDSQLSQFSAASDPDLYPISRALLFSMDVTMAMRHSYVSFVQQMFPVTNTPHWCIQTGFSLIVRLQRHSELDDPDPELFKAIESYGHDLPAAMRPIAQTPGRLEVTCESARMCNLIYHSAMIMWYLKYPTHNVTESDSDKAPVPVGAKPHARRILGLLKTCDKPFLIATVYWSHRVAAACMESDDERDEVLGMKGEYEWRTGYTFGTHFKWIEDRWSAIDSGKSEK